MHQKPFILLAALLLLSAAVLTACGGAAPQDVTVEVTRVITETVAVEGESVVVTRPATEESASGEPAPAEGSTYSTGSESANGDGPPPPETGAKVEVTRAETMLASDTLLATAAPAGDEAARLDIASDVALPLDQNSRLTAGEVDDNAGWDDYLLYLREYAGAAVIPVDVSERHQIRVTDSQGNPVLGAQIAIQAGGQAVVTLRTHSNGLAYFFPRAFSGALNGQATNYTVNVTINNVTESLTIPAGGSQREWVVVHRGAGQVVPAARLDVLFLIDATGSMADEINQLKENIRAVAAQIDDLPANPDVRFGMVAYRDRGDEYVARVFDFTPDVEAFAGALAEIYADGGGDYPEDLNEALSRAVHEPEWRVDGSVSLIFLVADAPPHLDYGQQNHYAVEMMAAAERGIKIYPIASSGLDTQGEYVFRQLAQYTGGRFIFLTYGAGGPGTTGTETDFQVSDYTVSSLDALVVKVIEEELSYLVR